MKAVTLALLAAGVCVRADLITDLANVSIYGKIVKLEQGELVLVASFPAPAGTVTKAIAVSKLRRIEFNKKSFNDGAPPKALGLHEPPEKKGIVSATAPPEDTNTGPGDTIYLRDGSEKSCTVIAIDDESVKCSGGITIPHEKVKSIRFGERSK
jgi:hypothetical protein